MDLLKRKKKKTITARGFNEKEIIFESFEKKKKEEKEDKVSSEKD